MQSGAFAVLPPMTVVRSIAMLVTSATLSHVAVSPATGAAKKAATCQVIAPIMETVPRPRPWRWLGECPNGRAEGLGVLRMGTDEGEVTSFYGRMHAGRPVAGLLDMGGSVALAKAFTPAGVAIEPDGHYPEGPKEHHGVFVLGSRAALATSRWFAARGNGASARWYRSRAREILDGEPE